MDFKLQNMGGVFCVRLSCVLKRGFVVMVCMLGCVWTKHGVYFGLWHLPHLLGKKSNVFVKSTKRQKYFCSIFIFLNYRETWIQLWAGRSGKVFFNVFVCDLCGEPWRCREGWAGVEHFPLFFRLAVWIRGRDSCSVVFKPSRGDRTHGTGEAAARSPPQGRGRTREGGKSRAGTAVSTATPGAWPQGIVGAAAAARQNSRPREAPRPPARPDPTHLLRLLRRRGLPALAPPSAPVRTGNGRLLPGGGGAAAPPAIEGGQCLRPSPWGGAGRGRPPRDGAPAVRGREGRCSLWRRLLAVRCRFFSQVCLQRGSLRAGCVARVPALGACMWAAINTAPRFGHAMWGVLCGERWRVSLLVCTVLREWAFGVAPLILAFSCEFLEGWVWFLAGWYCKVVDVLLQATCSSHIRLIMIQILS